MESQLLQQLQNDIKEELSKSLKNASFRTVLEKYGITEEKVIHVQCTIDLSKTEFNDRHSLLPGKHMVQLGCDWCDCCGCCG